MDTLLSSISKCDVCAQKLELGPRPIISANTRSKIVIIGQAPGSVVHKSGIPWDDKSGQNLRAWMGIDNDTFYNSEITALIPMGFCYPGKGKSGDLPPTKECAPLWHQKLLSNMKDVELILLIGTYAQQYYLGNKLKRTLTESVKNYKEYLPNYFVLPHPSPRNNIWQAKNEWFKKEVIPELQNSIKSIITKRN
ncbi:uracil-DNA glycosylase family protein [Aquimarina sp. MMG015]|uniref:uracil-DNA glycosylase family protein n=1 Tax=Aquimarina sp. MMG015 TaxID=2822689 RepID=UPI001B3A3D2D|nr:uracil-DNA glycosylase family protein [Aquimarina sp. MMG015]MBQ4804024.1 uracil-DNA glycosylase family protein [Aquimarina sp. MMG015]